MSRHQKHNLAGENQFNSKVIDITLTTYENVVSCESVI